MRHALFLLLFVWTLVTGNAYGEHCAKKNMQWDQYPLYPAYVSLMNKFAADHPAICRLEEFGQSVNGRKLLAAVISDSIGKQESKPKVFYIAALHGNEVTAYVLMLRLIYTLLASYGVDSKLTKYVDSIEIWIAPLANPDGTFYGGDTTLAAARRANANGIDLNRNFPTYLGTTPTPEPETKALLDLFCKNNFTLSTVFHDGDQGIFYPWAMWTKPTADQGWWYVTARKYSDLVYTSSGGKIYDTVANLSHYSFPYQMYDCSESLLYFYHSRCLNVALTRAIMPPPTTLPDLWQAYNNAFFYYMEQSLYGIRGIVADSLTGAPLQARVFVDNHDIDSSQVYSNLPCGTYYRPIAAGVYSITYSCDGYIPQSTGTLTVVKDKATIVNVKLLPVTNPISSHPSNAESFGTKISVKASQQGVEFRLEMAGENTPTQVMICDARGTIVYRRDLNDQAALKNYTAQPCIRWDMRTLQGTRACRGVYFVRFGLTKVTGFSRYLIKRFVVG